MADKIKKCNLDELYYYIKLCGILIRKNVEGCDSYRTVPESTLSEFEQEEYSRLSKKYKEYTDIEKKLLNEAEERIKGLM